MSALLPSGARRELELEEHWPHQRRMVLKFRGVDSISDAEALTGAELQIARSERAVLAGGAAYVSDLVGSALYDGAQLVGRIEAVQPGAGDAPLLVVRQGGREHLVPFAAEFVRGFDAAAKRLEMALPAGLLELDAPLSEEEKRAQRGEE